MTSIRTHVLKTTGISGETFGPGEVTEWPPRRNLHDARSSPWGKELSLVTALLEEYGRAFSGRTGSFWFPVAHYKYKYESQMITE